jgi:hypothetical protein
MGYSSWVMYRKGGQNESEPTTKSAPWADYLRLHSSYYDRVQ